MRVEGVDLGEVVFLHHDVAALGELVALDHLAQGHFTLALRAPPLLLDARLALGVELVEESVAADSVAGNTRIGMFTRLTFRNPFHVDRTAMESPSSAKLEVEECQVKSAVVP